MSSRTFISPYTPSNTDPEVLERIFVQRQKQLKTVTRRLAKSMSSGDKYHVLLSGPRGCGKTCFLTLVHYRLTQDSSLSDSMRIAWLGEDAVITSLIDLALEMADQLAAEYPDEFNADIRSTINSLSPDDAAESIFKDIVKRLKNRHLLLMMENLDRAFQGLRDGGQKKWRAFLQESKKIATLATTQQLFDGVSKRDEAFFGFFDIHHLQPLSCEDASRLIIKVAHENKNEDLVKFLNTSEGRFRIRALRHLAGGNHRMYILLSEFLTKDSLDELVGAFEHLAEELTPYFQERLRSLPPQQARVVQSLCNADGALTVKAVAADTFLPERNCSKHLGELKKKRYVISERRGKESYYEMAEPLMRLCLEIKNQRGRPLRLIALFLRAWFSEERLQALDDKGTRSDDYRAYALKLEGIFEEAVEEELDSEIQEKCRQGKYDEALELIDELAHVNPLLSEVEKLRVDLMSTMADFVPKVPDLLQLPGLPNDLYFGILSLRSTAYEVMEDFPSAVEDLSAIIENPDAPARERHRAMFNLPAILATTDLWSASMAALKQAFVEGDPSADEYGGTPYGILRAVLRKGAVEWAVCANDLMHIYSEYGVCDKLCTGLTRAIEYLDAGDYSHTQLDAWNDAWQKAGQGNEVCEIALRSLDLAIQSIKAKSDRPLFELPLEIRELILPLLPNTCG